MLLEFLDFVLEALTIPAYLILIFFGYLQYLPDILFIIVRGLILTAFWIQWRLLPWLLASLWLLCTQES